MKERTIRLILILLCIILNTGHVFILFATYFKYDISTKVSIAYPEIIKPPTITLCFYLLELIDWDKANQSHPSGVSRLGTFDQYSFARIGKCHLI